MSRPYREGAGWAIRRRVRGQDFYVSGCATATEARKALERRLAALEGNGRPYGFGPHRTTLAQALQDYALQRLPFLKAAAQDADRINRYLRAAGLATLRTAPCEPTAPTAGRGQHFVVTLAPPERARRIPRGLGRHRARQAAETVEAEQRRAYLVRLPVAKVQAFHVQAFLDALRKAGRSPATLQLERAVLRGFFNYARRVWKWSEPADNPAVGLRLPQVDNARDRVMSFEEQRRLDEAIQTCRNALVGPTLTLLTETAMRSSEPLQRARWGDVDWDNKLLKLRDSKTTQRDVPLSPKAIEALRALQRLNPGGPDDRLVRISYEALKAAWQRACERAGITDLKLHDLRHTAATRLALKTGNIFLVQALTGHRTLSQLERYVNVKAKDVVAVLHAGHDPCTRVQAQAGEATQPAGSNVIRVAFGRKEPA